MGRWILAALTLLAAGSWKPVAGNWHPAAGTWQQSAQPPTFRSGTQIVQVDVRVLNDGRFVTDLGAADFQIKENGVPQKIESVVLVGGPAAPPAPAPSAPSAPAAPSAPTASPQVWVFFFDTDHLSPGGLSRTREAIVKFINERFHDGDLGGVVADGKMANNRLTSNREELRQAAATVKMPGDLRVRQVELREWPRLQDDAEAWMIANGNQEAIKAATQRACTEDPAQCSRAPVDMQIQEKARRLAANTRTATSKVLKEAEALTNGLARMPGTKSVVFLSEGFFLQSQETELRQTVGMAARAGARFYTIDARGLNRGSASGDIIDQPAAALSAGAGQKFDTQADGLNSLGVDTGGFAIRNENNFGRALGLIQQDSATYYVVSYSSTNTTFDGAYRTIDVSVTRPGVKVRARRGYLALEPAVLLPPASRPRGASAPRVAPKAELLTPELPVSRGLLAVPEASAPGETVSLLTSAATSHVVRTRIDGGRMVAALGRTSASAAAPASARSSGATASAEAEAGWAAYEKGDVVAAATHLAEAAKASDARPWVHYALGLAQFAQQHYKEAASAWGRVRRDVPEFEPIYFSLADAYGLQHDEGAAIKVLREAERRWPSDPEVFDAIGVIQVRRGALDAAIASFEQATKVAPGDALGYFNLGRTLQMRLRKSQRYDPQLQKWVGGDDDRKRAAASFQKYLDLGGPYESQAREALSALRWR